jgi:hypothetical protein
VSRWWDVAVYLLVVIGLIFYGVALFNPYPWIWFGLGVTLIEATLVFAHGRISANRTYKKRIEEIERYERNNS